MTQRFPPIPMESMTPEQLRVANDLINGPRKGLRGPFNALLRNPVLTERVAKLGDSIRFENTLPALLREFAIMITAQFWSADYEWHAHSKLAIELGLNASIMEDVRVGRRPNGMSAQETLVYQLCHEILVEKDIADDTYARAVSELGEITLLDLLTTVAYFGFVSVVLNAIRMPVPEGGNSLTKSA